MRHSTRFSRLFCTAALGALAVGAMAALPIGAQAQTWTGEGRTNKWSDNEPVLRGVPPFISVTNNWLFGLLPVDGAVVSIDPTLGSSFNTMDNDISGLDLKRLVFATNSREMRLTGKKISLTAIDFEGIQAEGIQNNSFNEQNIDLDIDVKDRQTWETQFDYLLDVNGDVNVGSNRLELVGNINLDGDLSGTGTIHIDRGFGHFSAIGNRTRLSGNNSAFTGDFSIDDGVTLRLDGGDNLSDETIVLVGGTLDLNGTAERFGGISDYLRFDGTVEAGTVDLGGGAALHVDHSVLDLTFSGDIVGSGSFTKSGVGTQRLGGENTFTGLTTVNGGTLEIIDGSGNALVGGLVVNGGVMAFGNDDEAVASVQLIDGEISGDGKLFSDDGNFDLQNGLVTARLAGSSSVTKSTTGEVILSGSNSYTGGTVLNAGTLVVTSSDSLGASSSDLTFNGGKLTVAATMSNDRTTTLNDIGHISVLSGQTFTQNSSITGNHRLAKSGDGTLVLNNSNTYMGPTSIFGGVLQISSSTNLGAASGGLVLSGGALASTATMSNARATEISSGGGEIRVAASTTFSQDSNITGTGGLTKSGDGTFVLNGTGTYTGGTVVTDGVFQLGGSNKLTDGSALTVSGGTFDLQTFNETVGAVTLTSGSIEGTGTLTGSSFTMFSGTASANLAGGALTKKGPAVVELLGTNTYTGGTTIEGGTLVISSNESLGNSAGGVTLDEGTLRSTETFEMTRDITLTCLASRKECEGDTGGGGGGGGGGGQGGGGQGGGDPEPEPEPLPPRFGTFEVDGSTTLTLNGVISGEGGLAKDGAGTLVLNGSNTYTGGTQVNEGTLALSSSGSIASTAINVGAAGTFDFSAKGDDIFGGALINQGIVKADGLQLTGTVSGAGSYQGAVTFNGDFRPGNSPALVTAEDVIFGSGNILTMELGGLGRGSQYDAFNITGNVTFGGNLDIGLINGFSLGLGNSFDLFNFDPLSAMGMFASIALPTLSNLDWEWDTSQLYSTGIIAVVLQGVTSPDGVPGPGAIFILVVGLAGFGALRRMSE